MRQRNTLIDLEMNQQAQGYLHAEPCLFLPTMPTYPQPDIPTMVTTPGNMPNLEAHHLPDPYETPMFYGVPQYHGVQHHHPNLDVGSATAPNFYVPYVFPHGQPSHLPSFSNHGDPGVPSGESEGNGHLMDTARGLCKIKNAVGTPTNSQYLNPPAAPSFSFTPLNTTDGASFALPQFRGTGNASLREVGPQRSARNGLGMDPVIAHVQNNFFQGNYVGQPFPPPGSLWFDPQLSNGRTDGSPSSWSCPPSLPYMHGTNVTSGSIESGNGSLQRYYHDTSSNRNSAAFVYPPPVNSTPLYFSHNQSTPAIQGVRGHRTSMYPHVAAPTQSRVPGGYATQGAMPDGLDMGSTHAGPVQPAGFRMVRHHREGLVPEPTLRHRNLPHMRVMPADEVALLEVGDLYDAGSYIDHHRDMRLDIEDMSYEELLALSERIGTVNTGLSEDKVANHLKTRIYLSSQINLEEAPPVDQETDSCTICQENYKAQEKIGALDCGHEYHADCLKKWLVVKNVCPICKSEALAPEKKNV